MSCLRDDEPLSVLLGKAKRKRRQLYTGIGERRDGGFGGTKSQALIQWREETIFKYAYNKTETKLY